MKTQILKLTTAVALLLDSSAATQSHLEKKSSSFKLDNPIGIDKEFAKTGILYPSDGVVNKPDGMGGPAPCIESYTYV